MSTCTSVRIVPKRTRATTEESDAAAVMAIRNSNQEHSESLATDLVQVVEHPLQMVDGAIINTLCSVKRRASGMKRMKHMREFLGICRYSTNNCAAFAELGTTGEMKEDELQHLHIGIDNISEMSPAFGETLMFVNEQLGPSNATGACDAQYLKNIENEIGNKLSKKNRSIVQFTRPFQK